MCVQYTCHAPIHAAVWFRALHNNDVIRVTRVQYALHPVLEPCDVYTLLYIAILCDYM